jgi:hypothetical protein
LYILSFIGYNDGVVEEYVEDFVVRHEGKDIPEGRVRLDDGSGKVKAFHFEGVVFVLLTETLHVYFSNSTKETHHYFFHEMFDTFWRLI